MLDEPQVSNKFGGTIAAPLVGDVLADSLEYMGVSKQYTENEKEDIYVEVPELRGTSKEKAGQTLTGMGLRYTVKGSGSTVVDQLPSPDERLETDSLIILYTQDRDEEDLIEVPDLTGYSVKDSKYLLNMRGLNFEISGAGHSESYNAYAVSQTMEKGTRVQPGTVIGVEFRQQTND